MSICLPLCVLTVIAGEEVTVVKFDARCLLARQEDDIFKFSNSKVYRWQCRQDPEKIRSIVFSEIYAPQPTGQLRWINGFGKYDGTDFQKETETNIIQLMYDKLELLVDLQSISWPRPVLLLYKASNQLLIVVSPDVPLSRLDPAADSSINVYLGRADRVTNTQTPNHPPPNLPLTALHLSPLTWLDSCAIHLYPRHMFRFSLSYVSFVLQPDISIECKYRIYRMLLQMSNIAAR